MWKREFPLLPSQAKSVAGPSRFCPFWSRTTSRISPIKASQSVQLRKCCCGSRPSCDVPTRNSATRRRAQGCTLRTLSCTRWTIENDTGSAIAQLTSILLGRIVPRRNSCRKNVEALTIAVFISATASNMERTGRKENNSYSWEAIDGCGRNLRASVHNWQATFLFVIHRYAKSRTLPVKRF